MSFSRCPNSTVSFTSAGAIASILFAMAGAVFLLSGSQLSAQQSNADPAKTQANQQMDTLAVVNGQPISRQHLGIQCVRRFGADVLRAIIKKQLVYGECQRQGIRITEKDINDEITMRASKFRMSAEAWINLICTRRNFSPDRLRNDVIWHDVALRRLAADQIRVTPEELQKQIDIEFGDKVQIREIVCKDMETAKQMLARVTGPDAQDFGLTAKDHSLNAQSAAVRGLLPVVTRHVSPPEIEDVIFKMQPNDISDPIKVADDQFIILKCEQVYPAMELNEEQATAVHERLVDKISEAKLSTIAQQIANKLQSEAEIVNVHNDPKLSQEMPGVAAIVNGNRITKRLMTEECIAQFGTAILASEINLTILRQTLKERGTEVTNEDIQAEIAQAAEGLGYQNPDGSINKDAWLQFVTRGDMSKVDFYIDDELWPSAALRKLVKDSVTVTEEDMQKGFEANFGPRVEVLMIVFQDQRQATKVWNMAMANKSEKYFGKLANQYSIDPASQANFGEVAPVRMHGGYDSVEKAAFSLQKGEVSDVVQFNDQYVVLMCRGRTTPRITDFDDVKEHLARDIQEKKTRIAMGRYFERLTTTAQIDNYLVGTSQAGERTRTANGNNNAQRLPFKSRR